MLIQTHYHRIKLSAALIGKWHGARKIINERMSSNTICVRFQRQKRSGLKRSHIITGDGFIYFEKGNLSAGVAIKSVTNLSNLDKDISRRSK
jgi:hypothetical protein